MCNVGDNISVTGDMGCYVDDDDQFLYWCVSLIPLGNWCMFACYVGILGYHC